MIAGTPKKHDPRELLRPTERILSVIWWAFTLTPVLIALIAWFVAAEAPPEPDRTTDSVLRTTLHVSALGLAIASLLARSLLLSDKQLLKRLGSDGDKRGWLELGNWITVAFLVGWCTNELVLLLGVGLVLVTGDIVDLAPFLFVTMMLQVLAFPRVEPFIQRTQALMVTKT